MNKSPLQLPPEQPPKVTFPFVNIAIGLDGMKVEVFFGPGTSFSQVIDEHTVNAMLKQWVENRKKLREQQKLIGDVMRSKQEGG